MNQSSEPCDVYVQIEVQNFTLSIERNAYFSQHMLVSLEGYSDFGLKPSV